MTHRKSPRISRRSPFHKSTFTEAPPPYPTSRHQPALSPPGRSRREQIKVWLAGGSMLALVGVLVDVGDLFAAKTERSPDVCQEVVDSTAVLSREQLSELIAIPEREPKDMVRAIVQEPYCTLPDLEVRAHVTAEREAYPLEFDPKTWFIVLYEEGEYAGYDFSFRR